MELVEVDSGICIFSLVDAVDSDDKDGGIRGQDAMLWRDIKYRMIVEIMYDPCARETKLFK